MPLDPLNPSPESTSKVKFAELTGVFLSAVQMILALKNVKDYEKRLNKLAEVLFNCEEEYPTEDCDNLKSLALKHRCRYHQMRNRDKDFKDWYDRVPNYDVCERGIYRSKGHASQELGSAMRKLTRMNNGYTPLAMVGKVAQGTMGFVKYTSSVRAYNHNAEMKRKMEDQLLHWRMLVSIPVEQEGNYANFNPAISAWTQSMGNWAQGFNSGAAAFGTSLYNLIHSGNQNQRTYGSIPVNTAGQQTISIGWPNNVART